MTVNAADLYEGAYVVHPMDATTYNPYVKRDGQWYEIQGGDLLRAQEQDVNYFLHHRNDDVRFVVAFMGIDTVGPERVALLAADLTNTDDVDVYGWFGPKDAEKYATALVRQGWVKQP